jgi:hypothetical protein
VQPAPGCALFLFEKTTVLLYDLKIIKRAYDFSINWYHSRPDNL